MKSLKQYFVKIIFILMIAYIVFGVFINTFVPEQYLQILEKIEFLKILAHLFMKII